MALRTLRQVAKVVGETAGGDPIVEVRSTRLVLHGDSDHFNRMVSCSKCGSDAPGPPIWSPADLDQRVNAVICKDCVKAASSSVSSAKRAIVAESRPAIAPPPLAGTFSRARHDPVDDRRLTALERQISELTGLLKAQRSEQGTSLEELTRKTEAGLSSLVTISHELAQKQEGLGRAVDEAGERARRRDVVESEQADDLERRIEAAVSRRVASYELEVQAAMADRIEAIQRASELETARMRADLAHVAQGQDELTGDFRLRTDGVSERLIEATTAGAARHQALEMQLRQLQSHVKAQATQSESDRDDKLVELAEQLDRTRTDLAAQLTNATEAESERLRALELRVQESVAGGAERFVAQQVELRSALELRVEQLSAGLVALQRDAELQTAQLRSELAQVAQGHDALGEDLRQRTDGVVDHLAEAATASNARVQALEELLRQLQGDADAETARAQADAAPRSDLVRLEEQLDQMRSDLAAQVTGAAEAESERLLALEVRVQEVGEGRSEAIEARQAELRSALEAKVQQLSAALKAIQQASELETARIRSDLVRVTQADDERSEDLRQRTDSVAERLAETAAASTVRLEALEAHLRRLESNSEAEAARGKSDATDRDRVATDLIRLREEIDQTRDDLATRLTNAAADESVRFRALELRVQEVVDSREMIEAKQVELRTALRQQAANVVEHQAKADTVTTVHLESLDEHLRELQLKVEAETARAQADAAPRSDLVRLEERLDHMQVNLAAQLAQAAEAESARLQAVELRMQSAGERRTDGMESQHAELRSSLEARVEQLGVGLERYAGEAGEAVARVSADNADVRRSQEEMAGAVQGVLERVEGLAAAVAGTGGTSEGVRRDLEGVLEQMERFQVMLKDNAARSDSDSSAREAAAMEVRSVEERLNQRLVLRATELEDRHRELQAALESGVGQLRTALDRETGQLGTAVAGLSAVNDGLRRSHDDLNQGLHGALERLQQLQVTVDAEVNRARSESAGRDDLDRKAARNGDLLQERLAHLIGAIAPQTERLQAVEAVVNNRTEQLEAEQRDLRTALESSVEQVEAAVQRQSEQAEQIVARLDLLAEQVARTNERDEAGETGGAPEALESLRREVQTALADGLAVVQSGSEAQSADIAARIEALEHTFADRVREISDLVELQAALDTGMGRVRADLLALRAASEPSALGPLRSDVSALQEQMAAQKKVLAALKKSVETLRRASDGGATPATKKASRPAK